MCTKYLMIEISIFNKNYNCKKFYKEILIKFQIISCEKVLNYNKILQFLYKNVFVFFFVFNVGKNQILKYSILIESLIQTIAKALYIILFAFRLTTYYQINLKNHIRS